MIELLGIDDNTLYVQAEQILLIRRYGDGSRIDGITDFTIWVKETPKEVAIKVDNVHG